MVLLSRVFCATFCATAENSAAEEDRGVSPSAAAEDDVGSGGGRPQADSYRRPSSSKAASGERQSCEQRQYLHGLSTQKSETL